MLGVVDEVFSVTADDAQRAKNVVLGQPGLSARDALHAAVMERAGITRVMSFDRGFDAIPGLSRLHQ